MPRQVARRDRQCGVRLRRRAGGVLPPQAVSLDGVSALQQCTVGGRDRHRHLRHQHIVLRLHADFLAWSSLPARAVDLQDFGRVKPVGDGNIVGASGGPCGLARIHGIGLGRFGV